MSESAGQQVSASTKMPWSDASGLFFERKSGHFGVKSALFRAKKGQNWRFAVTDSPTE
jgi:hypothetical protein